MSRGAAPIATGALFLATTAFGQDAATDDLSGFDAHGFNLVALDADRRDLLTLQRADDMAQGDWFAGGILEFAKAPLVADTPDGERLQIVDNVFALNVSGGAVAHERVRFDLAAPLYFTATGQAGPEGVGIGDIRLASMVVLLAPSDNDLGLSVGLAPHLDLPSGSDARFLGQSGVAGGFTAAGSLALDDMTLTVNLGSQFNPSLERANLTGSDMLLAGLGFGYLVNEELGINYEIRGSAPFSGSPEVGTGSPWEGILSGRYVTDAGGHVTGGLAMGLSPGIGAAAFRVVLGGGFGAGSGGAPVIVDRDADSIADADDACPEVAGPAGSDGCPVDQPHMQVLATYGGQPMMGAEIKLEGAESRAFSSEAAGTSIDVPVDSMWRANAILGECLEGDGIKQMRTGDETFEIEMAFTPGAILKLVVLDVNGATVDGIRVRFESGDPHCTPPDRPQLDAQGTGSLEMGVGKHKIIIDAPGHSAYEEVFTLTRGDEREVFALLAPL